jgi:transcriptional accessory protein Tex/SPT6
MPRNRSQASRFAAHIEDVISRGDVLDVEVQAIDKERGRIGLELIAQHENGGS